MHPYRHTHSHVHILYNIQYDMCRKHLQCWRNWTDSNDDFLNLSPYFIDGESDGLHVFALLPFPTAILLHERHQEAAVWLAAHIRMLQGDLELRIDPESGCCWERKNHHCVGGDQLNVLSYRNQTTILWIPLRWHVTLVKWFHFGQTFWWRSFANTVNYLRMYESCAYESRNMAFLCFCVWVT